MVTEKGIGKCSPIDEYRVQKRGGKGIITLNRTDKTGDVVALKEVVPGDELMLITQHGVDHPHAGEGDPGERPQHAGREAGGARRAATWCATWRA